MKALPDRWRLTASVVALSALYVAPVAAQPAGVLGIGGQVGPDSGLSLRVVRATLNVSVLAAWNLDNFARVEAHLWKERPVTDSPLRLYSGPGVVLGVDHARAIIGAGLVTGTYFTRERFEVYLQLAPRVELSPDLRFALGSGVGLRYFP